MIAINPNRTELFIDALTTLWEASVGASHHFLTKEDIQKLMPVVKKGLSSVKNLIVEDDNHKPIAFLGVEDRKIEMLFVSPDYFGKGVGRGLAELAIEQHGALYVDVNEQNTQAVAFYRHIGFEVFKRRTLDEQGNPFPILKMELIKGGKKLHNR